MHVFWQHGYKDASLSDLLTGMGLTRGSLYKAFTDKRTLFLMALDRYEKAHVDAVVDLLCNHKVGNGTERIKALFAGIVAAAVQGDNRGCLLCTAAAGAAGDDKKISEAVHHGLTKLQNALAIAVKDVPGIDQNQHTLIANTLLTQYIGLRILVRSKLPLGILQQSVEGVAAILRGPA
jgi:TetR/AcrR family transcriptional repressor of nem operon